MAGDASTEATTLAAPGPGPRRSWRDTFASLKIRNYRTYFLPLLGPYGGVVDDRSDKLRLMTALQAVMGVQAALGAVLYAGRRAATTSN